MKLWIESTITRKPKSYWYYKGKLQEVDFDNGEAHVDFLMSNPEFFNITNQQLNEVDGNGEWDVNETDWLELPLRKGAVRIGLKGSDMYPDYINIYDYNNLKDLKNLILDHPELFHTDIVVVDTKHDGHLHFDKAADVLGE